MNNNNLQDANNIGEGLNIILSGMYTAAAGSIFSILDNVRELTDSEILKAIKEFVGDAGDTIEALKLLKKMYDIPTTLFMHKFARYCKGLSEIPLDKRQSYLENTEAISRKNESLFILNVLNKIEDINKIDMTVRLLEAKLDGRIDDNTYRRLVIMTGDTLYSDLCYMKDDINHDNFTLKNEPQEGLLGSGWIRPLGPGWGSSEESESKNLFAYNVFAKCFCQIVFDSDIEIKPPSDVGMITIATDEDINSIMDATFGHS